ncbi:hypothetical protein BaRGS_00023100, partial [Batillaria attramentaria]
MTSEGGTRLQPTGLTCCGGRIPVRGVFVVMGGILIHLTLGTQLTFGNTNPYLVSYIRKHSSPIDLEYIDGIWIQACMLMGQGVTMFVGGILEHKLGPRIACLIGAWALSAGTAVTYFTVKICYVTSVMTYGVVFGLGCGIAYAVPVTCAMRWFPNQRGFIGGLIFVGFGMGSTIFNQVITVYLNPDNIIADLTIGEDVYFTQDEVLERVPRLFLLLGGTYAVMQLIGVLLMVNPPHGYIQPGSTQEYTVEEGGGMKRKDEEADRQNAQTMEVWSSSVKEETPEKGDGSGYLEEATKPVEMDIHPLKMLRTKMFYLIWLLFLFGGMGGVFMSSMYKSYGQSFIKDDTFMAITGSCAAVMNAVGGVFWGYIADRFSFNVAAKLLYAMFATVSFTFIGSEYGLKPYFFIWVCLILFVISGKFTIMPPILTSAASAFMGESLKDYLHYHGLFFLIGGLSCI